MNAINPTNFENVPAFPDGKKSRHEHLVHAIVETPGKHRHKYAFEPKFGTFVLKVTLADGLQWPYDYGFIPQTLADDGDPLDVLLLIDEPTFAGCLVQARVIGIIHLKKNGEENDRVVACPPRMKGVAQNTDPYEDIDDVPKETLEGLCRFLVEYSEEEGNDIKFKGVSGAKKAFDAIEGAIARFEKKRSG